MSKDLVSIVIPCFNYGRFLAEAIESALDQTHDPIEVIVVDDGSTDDSAAIAAKFGSKLHYIYQENAGLCAARNTGVKTVRGKFITFLDADDIMDKRFVELTVKELIEHPDASFVYTQMRLFGREQSITQYPAYELKTLKFGNYVNASAMLRAEVFQEVQYDESFKSGWEDFDFYLSLGERGHYGRLLDRPLLNYRKHEAASSMVDGINQLRQRELMLAIIKKHRRLYSNRYYVRFVLDTLILRIKSHATH